MTLRLRLAFLFAAVLTILSGLFIISAQGQLLRHISKNNVAGAESGLDEEEARDLIREIAGVWLAAGIPVAGLSFLLGFLLAAQSVHYVRQINDALAEIHPEKLDRRIKVPDRDPELQNLARGINALLDRIGRSYGELSEFSSRVAHELRTPLTLLRLRLEENAAKLPPDFSEDLQEEIRRLSRLVERSLVTARAEGGILQIENTPLLICENLVALREDYTALAELKGIRLHWNCPKGVIAVGDKDASLQIMHNLLDNALRYTKSEVAVQAWPPNDSGRIRVEITNDVRDVEPVERGTGIGLRLSHALAKTMPGWELRAGLDGSVYRATFSAPTA